MSLEMGEINVIEMRMMDTRKYYPLTLASGFSIRSILYPFMLIKTRLQIQRGNSLYKGTFDAFLKIARREGVAGLYRGFWVSCLHLGPSMSYITSYEWTRHHLSEKAKITNTKVLSFASGGVASVIGQTFSVPIDIVTQHLMLMGRKTESSKRVQEKLSSLQTLYIPEEARYSRVGAVKAIVEVVYRQGGIMGFYKGYVVSLLAFAPNSALWWFFYDIYSANFSEADSNKMMNKINFHATEVGRHENVLAMIGAVLDSTHLGPVMVQEFCEMGQLDSWLLKQNGKADEETMEKLYRFSRDIACGMSYLASKKIVHERLAARNVLLTFFLDAKVAGFGPQYASDGQIRIPVKWAAPEVLEDKPATEKSDVWSFGITLWEIFSLGQQPYPDIRSTEIGTRLKSGYRMSKPEFADNMFYKLMTNCWEESPGKRQTFKFISDQLSGMFKPRERRSEDIYYATNPSH